MSPPPCTLFWPRSGLSPAPGRPTCPHNKARLINDNTLSTPLWCSVIPSVQQICAVFALPKACASSRIASAGTPVTLLPCSSVHSSTDAAYSAKPLVEFSMKDLLVRPAWMISRARVLDSATSEPTLSPNHKSAHCAVSERRGSTVYILAPL